MSNSKTNYIVKTINTFPLTDCDSNPIPSITTSTTAGNQTIFINPSITINAPSSTITVPSYSTTTGTTLPIYILSSPAQVPEPLIDRIIANEHEKDFQCGDLIKSVDNKLGLVININTERVRGNYKTIYYKVMYLNQSIIL